MNLRFSNVIRGRGEVFIRLVGVSPDCRYSFKGELVTEHGEDCPVKFRTAPDQNGIVVIIPYLRVRQILTVTVVDDCGNVVGEVRKAINPSTIMAQSKLATAIKYNAAESIRNCDIETLPTGIEVHVHHVVADGSLDILHGFILLRHADEDELAKGVTLKLIDNTGIDVQQGKWTNMGESVSYDRRIPGILVRRISFTVRVPSFIKEFTIWATSDADDIADEFTTYEQCWLQPKREDCNRLMLPADRDPDYENWFLNVHRETPAALARQASQQFENNPLFSFVVPVFNTPICYLKDMVDSVLSQTYGNLELILAVASPDNAELLCTLKRYADSDDRVKFFCLDGNEGISRNTAAAVARSTGDFVCFLDHDDVIEPNLLFEYVEGINQYPDTDLLYCDEDKLLDGHYITPFLKPDWSPNLLCSFNYVTHLLTARTDMVKAFGVFSGEFDGAQDHDLTYRIGEHARNVYHARKILYHWRIHPDSTASGASAKPYTSEAGVKALQAHLDRCSIPARAELRDGRPNTYRVIYDLNDSPLITIVIPNKDLSDLLVCCVDSIFEKSTYSNIEILIVENNSVDDATFTTYKDLMYKYPRVKVITADTQGVFNYSALVNYGCAQAAGEYILLLNNDVEVISPRWLEAMLGLCQRADIGIVGAKLLFPDDTIQHAGVVFQRDAPDHIGRLKPAFCDEYFNLYNVTRDLSAVTAACMMFKKETFEIVGGFDEILPVDYNDIDFCLRVRKTGLSIVYESEAVLYHKESVSRGHENITNDQRIRYRMDTGLMMERWPAYWEFGDPFSNPNLMHRAQYHQLRRDI